jgi:hypothetical protein
MGLGVWGFEFLVHGVEPAREKEDQAGFKFGFWVLGFGMGGLGFRISGAWCRTGEEKGGPGVAEVLHGGTSYFLEAALLLPRLRRRLSPPYVGFRRERIFNELMTSNGKFKTSREGSK